MVMNLMMLFMVLIVIMMAMKIKQEHFWPIEKKTIQSDIHKIY